VLSGVEATGTLFGKNASNSGFQLYLKFQMEKNMITVYHNPRCRKSRAGLDFVKSKAQPYTVVEYLKTPFSREQFKEILMKLNVKPFDMVRTQEDLFRQQYKGKNFNDEEWITILLENPNLIQRPVIVKGYKAVIGQTEEEINKLI
jgi:arsenate reductase (glutaredoxin)